MDKSQSTCSTCPPLPQELPDGQRTRIKEFRRRHDEVFRAVIEEGAATGEFTAPTVLHCMHAGMSQAPVWCGGLKGQRLTAAIDELTDTLMMLVGELPARAAGR